MIGSLCATCVHVQRVASAKGSVFLRCQLERTDPRFPKYPPQPVTRCSGHQAAPPEPPSGEETR